MAGRGADTSGGSQGQEGEREERGFRFPFGPGAGGGFELVGGAELVEQSLRLLLRTATGERVMRPDYGCRIHDLLFAPNNASTRGRLAHDVREAIERWEPRARDVDVRVLPDRRAPERIVVELHYTCGLAGERRMLPQSLSLQDESTGA